MKISIANLGSHHSIPLALQLEKRGLLWRFYTGTPSYMLPKLIKPYAKTCPWLAIPPRLAGKTPWSGLETTINTWASLAFDRWLCRVLEPCDVFHCWASYGPQATIKAKAMGAVTVVDRGSTHLLHQRNVLKDEYRRWGKELPKGNRRLAQAELQQYWVAEHLVVPSQQAAETFWTFGYTPAVIPYGVDLMLFRPLPKEDNTFRVLFVGTLSLRKGIPYLLKAAQLVPKAEFWLVGPSTPEIESFLKHLPPNVRLFGAVDQTDLPWFYGQASCFVLPSVEEGLPLVLLQAMACEVPVMATQETGASEFIGTMPSRNPQRLANDIKAWMDSPETLRMIRKQYAERRSELSWDRYGEKMVYFYEKIRAAHS